MKNENIDVNKKITFVRKKQLESMIVLGVILLITILLKIDVLSLPGGEVSTDDPFYGPLHLLKHGGPWLIGGMMALMLIIMEMTIKSLKMETKQN